MDLVQGERVLYAGRPSPRGSVGFYLRWGLLALIPGVLASVVSGAGGGTGLSVGQWWLVTIVLLALVVAWDALRRMSVRYTVTSERIHIRRGLLSRAEQSTDIDRVQNVNTDQSMLQRALGVGSVDFDTAGTEAQEASFRFAGIAHPHALVSTVQEYKIERERRRSGDTWT
ncbi:MAG: PH domain-containing protein [Thermoleophilia bacterium]